MPQFKKPLQTPLYVKTNTLNTYQRSLLKNNYFYYSKLSLNQQRYFEHRVASFIGSKSYVGRDGVVIDDKKKVLIVATAVMRTFGFTSYKCLIVFVIFCITSSLLEFVNTIFCFQTRNAF